MNNLDKLDTHIRPILSPDIFLCPICKTHGIKSVKNKWFCKNSDCIKSNNSFIFVNQKPILIDFQHSLADENSFGSNFGQGLVERHRTSLKKFLKVIFGGKSSKSLQNFFELQKEMELLQNPKILIIGGGTIGSGLDNIYWCFKKNILAFDVYDSDSVDFIADAHFIPVRDNSFDLVIIQAVIEHVLDPHGVVSEIHRVLKSRGLVYAETPFMQQVHEGPYDFSRFTESGHRQLFKDFEIVSSGFTSGVGSSLIWSLDFFFSGLFRSRIAGKLARIIFFWLRFFDLFVPDSYNIDGACGVYFLGKKCNIRLSDNGIVLHYKGNQKKK